MGRKPQNDNDSIENAKAQLRETMGRKPSLAADVEDAKAELRETMANLRRERTKR